MKNPEIVYQESNGSFLQIERWSSRCTYLKVYESQFAFARTKLTPTRAKKLADELLKYAGYPEVGKCQSK